MRQIRLRRMGRRWKIVGALLAASVTLLGCPAPPESGSGGSGSGGGSSGGSATADTVPPTTPTGLTTSGLTPTQVDLGWSASADNDAVAGYRVYRNGALRATLGAVITYRDTGLSSSSTYSYTVQAFDRTGNSSAQSVAVIVTTPSTVDTVAPSTPTGLTASAVSASRIDLSWSPSTDNVAVTGYRIFRNGTLIVTTQGNVTAFQDTGLSAGVTYVYTARAIDAAGNVSGLSTAASATTPATPDTVAPSVPVGLTTTAASPTQINLSWSASTDNVAVTGYRVYRDGVFIAILANVLSYQDTGRTAATTYSYNVDAVDAAGNASALSAPVSGTTLAAPDTTAPSRPTGLSATAVSPSQINLTWAASTDNVAVTGYRVYRGGSLLVTLGNVTAYQNTGLNPSTSYTYAVQALDAAGNASAQSTTATATTQVAPDTTSPSIPTGLTATTVSASRINLNWSASTDNVAVTGYRVYRNGVFLSAVGNVTSYQSSGLSASTTYTYNVDAIDAAGNASGTSAAATATTMAPNTATLAWDAVAHPNLSGYRIYYGTAPGVYLQAAGQGVSVGNVTTYTVTGLSSGTRYYFAATAFDTSNNESVYSNEVFKDIP